MTDTKVLLQKIAALKRRLSAEMESAPTSGDPVRAIEEKVHAGVAHGRAIDQTLRSAGHEASTPPAFRLSGRGARLLRKGRATLQELRAITEDAALQAADEHDPVLLLHREASAMIEMILRTVQVFPHSMSAQMRLCDGLEVVLGEVEERTALVKSALAHRKAIAAPVHELAGYLRAVAAQQPAGLQPLQALAERVIAEAKRGEPVRFLYESPMEPARFAAAHGWTVAQVMARILIDDAEWQPQLEVAVMATLVHDVGMVSVPADVLMTDGPLESDERRLIEKHTIVAEQMLEKLWPGGGWPIEAACAHHERNDGTGYPLGKSDIQLGSFVKLLAACDVYAALCTPRPHRAAFDTRTALTETLLLAEREYLDRASTERLLLLGFYPVGAAVELNDGAVGIVIGAHRGETAIANPDRPIVSIVQDAHGTPSAFPEIIDLIDVRDRRIVRGLNPFERRTRLGKQYPQLV